MGNFFTFFYIFNRVSLLSKQQQKNLRNNNNNWGASSDIQTTFYQNGSNFSDRTNRNKEFWTFNSNHHSIHGALRRQISTDFIEIFEEKKIAVTRIFLNFEFFLLKELKDQNIFLLLFLKTLCSLFQFVYAHFVSDDSTM